MTTLLEVATTVMAVMAAGQREGRGYDRPVLGQQELPVLVGSFPPPVSLIW